MLALRPLPVFPGVPPSPVREPEKIGCFIFRETLRLYTIGSEWIAANAVSEELLDFFLNKEILGFVNKQIQ